MVSKMVEHPIEMIHLCRQEIFRKKDRERSRWLYDKFQEAARSAELAQDDSIISFGKFCLEYSVVVNNDLAEAHRMRVDVCERAFNFIYAVGDRMARRFKSDICHSKGDGVSCINSSTKHCRRRTKNQVLVRRGTFCSGFYKRILRKNGRIYSKQSVRSDKDKLS